MSIETIDALVEQVKDESQPIEARQDALRHIATIRGESPAPVSSIAPADLSLTVSIMTGWEKVSPRIKNLTLQSAVEIIAYRDATSKQSDQRRV
jgi:hypothetical protein